MTSPYTDPLANQGKPMNYGPDDRTGEPFVVKPWDPPGLPPRTESQRCAHHSNCAYRDDDPDRCPHCHRLWTQPSIGCRDSFENPRGGPRRHPEQPRPPEKPRSSKAAR